MTSEWKFEHCEAHKLFLAGEPPQPLPLSKSMRFSFEFEDAIRARGAEARENFERRHPPRRPR
jgi:hypothetical protein